MFDSCSIATICPFIWASSAAVCLSPPTKNAAGQNTTMATPVVKDTSERSDAAMLLRPVDAIQVVKTNRNRGRHRVLRTGTDDCTLVHS